MIAIDKTTKLNAEEIFSRLMERKKRNMVARFRLPYTDVQVFTMLSAACRAEVESRHRTYTETDAYKKHLWNIAQWLTSDASTFGLFLCGNRGNGKSTIVAALCALTQWLQSNETTHIGDAYLFPRPGFLIFPAKEVVRLAKAYNNPTRENASDVAAYKHMRDVEVLCIDDLGTEPRESMNYGDFVTAVMDIIFYRYNLQLCTIATSNLAPTDIKTYYDERFADRFREMMFTISFGNEPSFRTL